MGWTSMSFPGSSYLPASTMNAVFSNFASLALQDSGAPLPLNGWNTPSLGSYGPGVSSYSSINAASYFSAGGQPAKTLIQSIYTQRTAIDTNSTQTFSTYLVASITPLFGDSLLKVRANLAGMVGNAVAGAETIGRANLCRAPNGVPVVLTDSVAAETGMGIFALGPGAKAAGALNLQYQEISPGSGVPLQYGIRYAPYFVTGSGFINTSRGDILVEEWR